VSFLEPHERQRSKKAKQHEKFKLSPPPSHVVVGQIAKHRIDSHPHQTLYHAKRLLGRSGDDGAIESMRHEVEFGISVAEASGGEEESNQVVMQVMHDHDILSISPHHVGSYVVNYLMDMTRAYLGHDNVQSAVICVPAKFDARQRQETVKAFSDAGITVTRILEEPSAAALAYGLHKKEGVEYILVYDFGGGTLDVSLLHVTEGFADVMGSDGDELLGGADFDAAVASLLHGKIEDSVDHTNNALKGLHATLGDEFEDELLAACPIVDKTPLCTLSSLHTTGEKLKIELSFFPEGDVRVESSCFAVRHDVVPSSVSDLCSSLVPIQLTLTTTEFDKVSQFLYDRAVLPVLRLLKELDLEPNNVDEVVMVGGTTRMPQIQRLVGAVFSDDTTINTHIDPDITVAYGAASIID
jgi:molecular chaperone DnaK (HSP70)